MKYISSCGCRIDGLCCLKPTVASTAQRRLHSWLAVIVIRDSLSKLCLETLSTAQWGHRSRKGCGELPGGGLINRGGSVRAGREGRGCHTQVLFLQEFISCPIIIRSVNPNPISMLLVLNSQMGRVGGWNNCCTGLGVHSVVIRAAILPTNRNGVLLYVTLLLSPPSQFDNLMTLHCNLPDISRSW